jgi:anti-repressor protein
MTEMTLIPVVPGNIKGHAAQLVDARQLHDFLGVGRDFSNWIKGRIQEYGFVEKQDYLLAKSSEKHQLDSPKPANQISRSPNRWSGDCGGDRRSIDYYLTLDMAKELAMSNAPNGVGRPVATSSNANVSCVNFSSRCRHR